MALQYLCDGCGKKLPEAYSKTRPTITVKIEPAGMSSQSGTFDLCQPCEQELIAKANPGNWGRGTGDVVIKRADQ